MAMPTLTKPKAPAPPRLIQRKDIEQFLETCDHARKLESQARNLRDMARMLERDIKAYVDANKEGPVRSINRSGYRLSIQQVSGTVSWMNEFVRVCGENEAQALRDAAPPREKLQVEEIKAKPAAAA